MHTPSSACCRSRPAAGSLSPPEGLLPHAQVLLLDEVTTFVDHEDQQLVMDTVRSIVDSRGVTALCVTHRLEELRFAHAASFLEQGRIRLSDTPAAVGAHMRSLGARAYA